MHGWCPLRFLPRKLFRGIESQKMRNGFRATAHQCSSTRGPTRSVFCVGLSICTQRTLPTTSSLATFQATYCGRTKSISHHLETMVETRTFIGIYVGDSNQKPGLLNGGAISGFRSHPQVGCSTGCSIAPKFAGFGDTEWLVCAAQLFGRILRYGGGSNIGTNGTVGNGKKD